MTTMKYLDLTLPTPAENLACDEALLDWCEESGAPEILRFWESPEHFVVVGYANKIMSEVNVAECEENKIPIQRRCTGGGTVLQGQGSLNYSLVLKVSDYRPLQSISATNQFILRRNQLALQPLLDGRIELRGQTDLAIGEKKFSGNSQRRRKNYLLFHGTFLLNFDLALIEKFLLMPSKEPDYRGGRGHLQFLTNLRLSPAMVKAALKEIWLADELMDDSQVPIANSRLLARQKYSSRDWNWKF